MGTTPHRWLLRQRALIAQRLLETTNRRSLRVWHGANLRQHFRRLVRTSPNAYGRTFGPTGQLTASPPSERQVGAGINRWGRLGGDGATTTWHGSS
jgi:hypothetical protein